MLHVASGDFEAAPCHFPAEKLQCDERGFKSIPLSLGVSGSRSLSGDVLLESWAVVLRYYVGSDVICFGHIDDATDSASKYAVCHGEIPAQATLNTLHASTADIAGQSSSAQSPGDWIRSSPFFNTLVWNSSGPSASEHLLDTQVCYGGSQNIVAHHDTNYSSAFLPCQFPILPPAYRHRYSMHPVPSGTPSQPPLPSVSHVLQEQLWRSRRQQLEIWISLVYIHGRRFRNGMRTFPTCSRHVCMR